MRRQCENPILTKGLLSPELLMRYLSIGILFLAGNLLADDDQMSNLILGTWSSSFNVPSPNGSTTKMRVLFRFTKDGQFTSDWAYAFNNGSAEVFGRGTWNIHDEVLTMQVISWQSNLGGYRAPDNYGPAPQFDDGPDGRITFTNQNTFTIHGATFIRH
jgi:hypothetical protein